MKQQQNIVKQRTRNKESNSRFSQNTHKDMHSFCTLISKQIPSAELLLFAPLRSEMFPVIIFVIFTTDLEHQTMFLDLFVIQWPHMAKTL